MIHLRHQKTIRFFFTVAASKQWSCEIINTKSTFLQEESISPDIFVKPPQGAEVAEGIVRKLQKVVYGLNDVSHN